MGLILQGGEGREDPQTERGRPPWGALLRADEAGFSAATAQGPSSVAGRVPGPCPPAPARPDPKAAKASSSMKHELYILVNMH